MTTPVVTPTGRLAILSFHIPMRDKIILFLATLLVLMNPLAAFIAWSDLPALPILAWLSWILVLAAVVDLIIGAVVYGVMDIKDKWTPLILAASTVISLLALGVIFFGLGLDHEARQVALIIMFAIETVVFAFGFLFEL